MMDDAVEMLRPAALKNVKAAMAMAPWRGITKWAQHAWAKIQNICAQ